jgi:hypothetical protein
MYRDFVDGVLIGGAVLTVLGILLAFIITLTLGWVLETTVGGTVSLAPQDIAEW